MIQGEGLDSSIGITTRYGLNGLGIKPRWGAKFSAHVQDNGYRVFRAGKAVES
jgi:hypothetical protein